jgi:hypothetical protein
MLLMRLLKKDLSYSLAFQDLKLQNHFNSVYILKELCNMKTSLSF